jgi:outer membrane lipoprotein-sorting protein
MLGLTAGSATAQKAAPAPLSIEDRALVTQASAYLQGLSLAKGRFVQTDPRGARTAGDLYLKRPGKMRFAYDPPQGLLVVSDGFNVSIADPRLKTFDRYPLGSTPLALLLAREIRLDRGVIIDRVIRLADGFSITARDGRKEAEGRIQLVFATAPMGLKSWTVTDAQGQSTRVEIDRLTPVASLDPSLFILRDPRATAPGPLKGPR